MPVGKFFLAQFLVLVLQLIAHRDCQTVHRGHFFDLEFFDLATQYIFGLGHLTCYLAVCHKTNCNPFAYSTRDQVCKFCIASIFVFQELTHKGPTTWGGKCTACTLWIKVKQGLFSERNVTYNIFVNVVVNCPLEPRIKIFANFQVNKAISKRTGHTISNTFVAFAITCRNNYDIVGQYIFANASVQNKLITCGLYTGCRTIHLV